MNELPVNEKGETQLPPGWLARDIKRAACRVAEWRAADKERALLLNIKART